YRKTHLRAAAIAISADEANGGTGLHGLTRMDKGAVLLDDAVLSKGIIGMIDLDIIPTVGGVGAGVVLGTAHIHGRYYAATGRINGITGFGPQPDSIAGVLRAGAGRAFRIGDPVGLGLDAGRDGQEIDEMEIDHGINDPFAIAGLQVQLDV